MYDVLIIGAGTAGLTAAIYTMRAGKTACVIESNMYGGQIVNSPAVENYPGFASISGYDYANQLYEQAKGCGADYVTDNITSVERGASSFTAIGVSGKYESRTLILATGAKRRKMGVAGEDAFSGKGVSYCATCDGMFFRGKDVAVLGGGNTAFDDALFLSNYCNSVTILHRRDGFRGEAAKLASLKERENVRFITDVTVDEITGDAKVSAIRYTDKKSGEKKELSVDGVFVAIGQEPDTAFLEGVVELDAAGYIVAGEDCETNVEGIYAAGDCRTKKIRQLTTAAADGTVAALAAVTYIE